jgi:multicomponent Na+:H+ antiporter subunit D
MSGAIGEAFMANRPLWAVLVSLAATALILASGRRPNLREAVTMLAAGAKAAIVFSMLPDVLAGRVVESAPLVLVPGIALQLRADALGLLFATLASGLWVITSVYSIAYMRSVGYGHQTGYYASFAVCLSATMGIAFAANLLTLFIFYEILTIATYPLVIHRRTEEAVRGGRKYLVYTLTAGQLFLVAVLWAQHIAPGGQFVPGGFLAGTASVAVLQAIFVLFIVGAGAKAAIMPLHGWLPTAMVAPTPVSALLHAVAVVKAGVFVILRVVGFVFGPEGLGETGLGPALAWVAAATIVLASIRALAEDNLKRRLAYSTVGQLSYVVLGAALATPAALVGAMFHVVAHAFMKITLFFCAGAIYQATHKENVSELDGLWGRMPVTITAFGLASLGIVGMPLFAGFVSKFKLGLGAADAGQGGFIAVLVASAILSTAYLLPVVYRAAFVRDPEAGRGKDARHGRHGGEAVAGLVVPLAVTALISLVLGVFPDWGPRFYELASMAARSIFALPMGLGGG